MNVGDKVIRVLAGSIEMQLEITGIDDEFIYCGPWKFCKQTGAEVDEDLDWGSEYSGSYLKELRGNKKWFTTQ